LPPRRAEGRGGCASRGPSRLQESPRDPRDVAL